METSEKTVHLLEREVANLRSEFEEFMSAISHDLSATFRQTEGFSQIILKNNEDAFDEKTKRHFEFIQNGIDKGSSILDFIGHLCISQTLLYPVRSSQMIGRSP